MYRQITLIDIRQLAIIKARMAQIEARIQEETAMNATANNILSGIATAQGVIVTSLQTIGTLCTNGFALAKTFYDATGIDRILRIFTFISTFNACVFVCNDIINVLLKVCTNIIKTFVWKDYKGVPFNLEKYISGSLESFFKSILGAQTIQEIEMYFASANRIYQSAGNVLTAVSSIGNSTLRACGIINYQISDLGDALKKQGMIAKDAIQAAKKNIDFQHPILTALKSVDNQVNDMAADINWVTQKIETVKNETGQQISKVQDMISKEEARFAKDYYGVTGIKIEEHPPTALALADAIKNSLPKNLAKKSIAEILAGK